MTLPWMLALLWLGNSEILEAFVREVIALKDSNITGQLTSDDRVLQSRSIHPAIGDLITARIQQLVATAPPKFSWNLPRYQRYIDFSDRGAELEIQQFWQGPERSHDFHFRFRSAIRAELEGEYVQTSVVGSVVLRVVKTKKWFHLRLKEYQRGQGELKKLLALA